MSPGKQDLPGDIVDKHLEKNSKEENNSKPTSESKKTNSFHFFIVIKATTGGPGKYFDAVAFILNY